MRTPRLPLWQKVVALAPLLLLALSLPGESLLRCRMDGLLRSSCCCPSTDDIVQVDQADGALPALKAQACCEREETLGTRPIAEPAREKVAPTAWTISVDAIEAPVALPLVAPSRPKRLWYSNGPPREGSQIVLLKHAFLI